MNTSPTVLKRALGVLLLLQGFLFAGAQTDTATTWDEASLTKYFKDLDLKAWEGKKVDSLLGVVTPTYTRFQIRTVPMAEHKGLIIFEYPLGLELYVFIPRFRFVNPNGMSRKRMLRHLRRERIGALQVRNELACLEGCD